MGFSAQEIRQFVLDVNGRGVDKKPKVVTNLLHVIKSTDPDPERCLQEVESLYMEKPVVQLYYGVDFCKIDFVFESVKDYDLRAMWEFMNRFMDAKNGVFHTNEEMEEAFSGKENAPIISFHDLTLELLIKASNPLSSVQVYGMPYSCTLVPERPGEETKILRMFFLPERVNFIEYAEEEAKHMRDEAEKALERQMMQEEAEAKRSLEKN